MHHGILLAGICVCVCVCVHVCSLKGGLLKVHGFDPACLKWCTLHTLNLGIVAWAAASVLLELFAIEVQLLCTTVRMACADVHRHMCPCYQQDVWPAPAWNEGLNTRLSLAYADFTSWARLRKIQKLV